MKWQSLVLVLCLALGCLWSTNAEPMKHPVTGEDGFWVSRTYMEETVMGLKERDIYRDINASLQISLETISATNDRLKKDVNCWVGVSVIEAIGLGGLLLWMIFWKAP